MTTGKVIVLAAVIAAAAVLALSANTDTGHAADHDIQILSLTGNAEINQDGQTKGHSLHLKNNGPVTEVIPYLIAVMPVTGCQRPGIDVDNNGTDDSFAADINLDGVLDSVAFSDSIATPPNGGQSGNDFEIQYGSCPPTGSGADLTLLIPDFVILLDACHSGDGAPFGFFGAACPTVQSPDFHNDANFANDGPVLIDVNHRNYLLLP